MKIICAAGKPENFASLIKSCPDYEIVLFPENGLSPNEQANIMTELQKKNADLLVFTHSAFVISDCKQYNVFYRDSESENNVVNPDFETFGASNNYINICIFERRCTIGNKSLSVLNQMKESFQNNGGKYDDFDLRQLGDSVEKTLFINQVLNAEDRLT